MGAYADVFLYRKSWHEALPSCAASERHAGANTARPGDWKGTGLRRKHVWMCGCSRNVFTLSGAVCACRMECGQSEWMLFAYAEPMWPLTDAQRTVWKYTGQSHPQSEQQDVACYWIDWFKKKEKQPFCERLSGLLQNVSLVKVPTLWYTLFLGMWNIGSKL